MDDWKSGKLVVWMRDDGFERGYDNVDLICVKNNNNRIQTQYELLLEYGTALLA